MAETGRQVEHVRADPAPGLFPEGALAGLSEEQVSPRSPGRETTGAPASSRGELGVTVLGSGSRGNAIVIQNPTEAILLDAGFSGREMLKRMRAAGVDTGLVRAVVVSHEHSDHVSGLRVCADRLGAPIYSNRRTADAIRYREGDVGLVNIFAAGSPFEIGEFRLAPFSIPHDASDPMGFLVCWRGCRIGVATDLGHASSLVCHQLRECDVLIVESNHDIGMLRDSSRPWALKQRILGRHGHLSNETSMELLKRVVHARTRHLVLAHASRDCNRYDLVERCATECLSGLGRKDIVPMVARQDVSLPTLWV